MRTVGLPAKPAAAVALDKCKRRPRQHADLVNMCTIACAPTHIPPCLAASLPPCLPADHSPTSLPPRPLPLCTHALMHACTCAHTHTHTHTHTGTYDYVAFARAVTVTVSAVVESGARQDEKGDESEEAEGAAQERGAGAAAGGPWTPWPSVPPAGWWLGASNSPDPNGRG